MRKSPANYYFNDFHIPARMAPAIDAWIDEGRLPGDFLQAVLRNDLRNDLRRALERADSENIRNLPAYLGYLYNEAPNACWGSPEKVQLWEERFAANRAEAEADVNERPLPAAAPRIADRIDGYDRDDTDDTGDQRKDRDDARRRARNDGRYSLEPKRGYHRQPSKAEPTTAQRAADRIDGYDRDDTGESPDY